MNTDLVSIFGNITQSLAPIQRLISGFAYLLGITFVISALLKLKKIAGAGGQSQEKMFGPIAYLIGGSMLIFLPTAMVTLSNTFFGNSNPLQYTAYNPYDIKNSIPILIRTAGLLWFVRGCVLLVHSSNPSDNHGPKGLVFLCAGIMAMNFESTGHALQYMFTQLGTATLSVKNHLGY